MAAKARAKVSVRASAKARARARARFKAVAEARGKRQEQRQEQEQGKGRSGSHQFQLTVCHSCQDLVVQGRSERIKSYRPIMVHSCVCLLQLARAKVSSHAGTTGCGVGDVCGVCGVCGLTADVRTTSDLRKALDTRLKEPAPPFSRRCRPAEPDERKLALLPSLGYHVAPLAPLPSSCQRHKL